MDITMLGTGHAMVTRCYNTCFTINENDEYFLVDAGGGNQILSILDDAEISINNIHKMFISHAHTDHILGAVWIVRKIMAASLAGLYKGNFIVYGHDKVLDTLKTICKMTLHRNYFEQIGKNIIFEEIKNDDKRKILGCEVTFFDIYSDKEKQFGFRMERADGTTIVCIGDEPYHECCEKYVKDCDYLMCEAFCLDADKDIFHPYEKFHSTALDAGNNAKKLGVKNLILYHTEDKKLDTRKNLYMSEAANVYDGNIFVPDDFEKIARI